MGILFCPKGAIYDLFWRISLYFGLFNKYLMLRLLLVRGYLPIGDLRDDGYNGAIVASLRGFSPSERWSISRKAYES